MKWLVFFLVTAALMLGIEQIYQSGYRDATKVAEQKRDKEIQALKEQQDEVVQALTEKHQNAIVKAQARQIESQKSAAAATVVVASLHKQLAKADQLIRETTGPPAVEYVTTINELFGECTVAYRELAEKADGHANDALMVVEAWPKVKD